MSTTCHLVAVTPDHGAVITIQTRAGWLLPSVERLRMEEALAPVELMLRELSTRAEVVHLAPLPRTTEGPLSQGYALAVVTGQLRSNRVEFTPREALESTPPLLRAQRTALETALRRLRQPEADFDTDVAMTAALDWAAEQIFERCGATVVSAARHRCMRYECVIRLDTTGGPMYLKGGRTRVEDEGVLTERLWRLAPSHLPRTVAIDRAAHRWVYQALAGEPLKGPLLTNENLTLAVTTLAALQRPAMHDRAVHDCLRARELRACDLLREVDACVRAAGLDPGTWSPVANHLARACAELDDLDPPMTLVLSDFWSGNILRTPRGIGFIDLERSYWSYPILPLWRLIHDLTRRSRAPDGFRGAIEEAFTTAWSDLIPAAALRALVTHLPMLGTLFALLLASRELDLEEQALGEPLTPASRLERLTSHLSPFIPAGARRSD
jgi:hypothetical protein